MKPTYVVCNGIMTDSDDVNGWTDIFEDYYQNEGYFCNRYEYTCGIFKSLFQGRRVRHVETICKRITRPIVYVGHSNGCEIFSRIIKETNIKFVAAHLLSAAMDADFNDNGLNYGLLTKKVDKIYMYCSNRDLALRNWASKTTFLRKIGIGYGVAGYTGPKNVLDQVSHRVFVEWNNDFGHSDLLNQENIQDTFKLTLRR